MATRRYGEMAAEDIAALQPLCEFDLSSGRMARPRMVIAAHALAFSREYGIDMRRADMGISYRLDESGDKPDVTMVATGHPRAPLHPEFGGSGKLGNDQHKWVRTVAERHLDCERVIAAGGDPMRPTPDLVIADPCLVRAVALAGATPLDLLDAVPAIGEVIVGRGWRTAKGAPRIVELGGLRAHVDRDVARITLVKLGIGDAATYEPPNHRARHRVGIVRIQRTQLPATVMEAMKDRPLSTLIDAPALDPGMTIRGLTRSSGSLVARLAGCDGLAAMA